MCCGAEVLNTVHILERLSCESCDYVRTTSNSTTQGLTEKREWRRDKNQGCYYDIINNHKTGVLMLL